MSWPQGHSATGRIMSMKNSNEIRNRTRDLPACSVTDIIFQVSWWWSSSRWFVSVHFCWGNLHTENDIFPDFTYHLHRNGFLCMAHSLSSIINVTSNCLLSHLTMRMLTVRYPSQGSHGTIFQVPLQCSHAFKYIWSQNDDLSWILNNTVSSTWSLLLWRMS